MESQSASVEYRLKDEKAEYFKGLGLRIKKIRKRHGLSQLEYACILSIESKELERIELGKSRPDIKLLYKVESHFEVNDEWLMTGNGRVFKKENWKEPIESDLQFLKMYNRLEDSGKKKMINVIKVFLQDEYLERQELSQEA